MEKEEASGCPAENEATVPKATGTQKKRIDKMRRKDPRSWENLSKTISTTDEAAKIEIIEAKYKELFDEMKRMQFNYMTIDKQLTVVQKENDHSRSELAKSVIHRARLENLCRELQKQNKLIKDENTSRIKEEEEKRKGVSEKLAEKLSDINLMMDESKEKSDRLLDENLKISEKLSHMYARFQKREEEFEIIATKHIMERNFANEAILKLETLVKSERETSSKKITKLENNWKSSEDKCVNLLANLKSLQTQIDLYKTQCEGLENTMTKSNRVFDGLRSQIESLSKQVSTLEKESQSWKNKFQTSTATIIELSELKQKNEIALGQGERKIEQLQKLCRQLQVDRAAYLKLLKSNGIEAVSQNCGDKDQPIKFQNMYLEREKEMLLDALRRVRDFKQPDNEINSKSRRNAQANQESHVTHARGDQVDPPANAQDSQASCHGEEQDAESATGEAAVENEEFDKKE